MKRKRWIKFGLLICVSILMTKGAIAETLHSALQEAVCSNPDIQMAVKEQSAAGEALKGAQDAYYPTLDANANAGLQHTENPFTTPSSPLNNGSPMNLAPRQVGLTADQMLYDGHATSEEVKRNQARLNSTGYKVAATSQDIALDTIEAYLDVLKEEQFMQLSQHNLVTHQNISNLISKRTKSGINVSVDYTQALGRLALAESDVESENATLADAKTTYAEVVGVAPDNLVMPSPPPHQYLPQTEAQAIQMALANHPELKAAKEEMAAAYAQHQAAFSKDYPRFDLQATGVSGQDINGIEGTNNAATASIDMNYNIFRGGADKAKQAETAYLYEESAAAMDKTYRQVVENVQVAWTAWVSAKNQLPLLKRHRDETSTSVNAYYQQYTLNKRTLLDVLNSENEYYQASRDYVEGQFVAQFAEYRLLNAIGSLMQSEGINLPPQTV